MDKHTLNLRVKTTKSRSVQLIDNDYNPVAKMVFYPDGLDDKAAHQIANAVNSHEELLVNLRLAAQEAEAWAKKTNGAVSTAWTLSANQYRRAIAKAEGK